MRNSACKELCRYSVKTWSIYLGSCCLGCIITLLFVPTDIVQHMTVHPSLHENAWEYIGHNLQIELLFLLGAVTFDVGTLFLLIFNGVTSSIFATAIALHYGAGFLLRGLLPHGIPETLAWLFIATCSFFMGSRLRAYFFQGKEESTTAKEQAGKEVHNSAAIYIFLLFMATLLILLAGFLEAYVSPHLI